MKFENTEVWGFEHALRGMRNPKNSWKRSDSQNMSFDDPDFDKHGGYWIGPKDMKLAQTLIKAGPEHRKFLRQIFVSVDITAPLYWWKEFSTYKVGTVANSTSTMHTIQNEPITLDSFEIDDFVNISYPYEEQRPDLKHPIDPDVVQMTIIPYLEYLRNKYVETGDKVYWKELIRWTPNSWLQKRTVTMTYENLLAMCSKGQRRFHKLNEWSGIDNNMLEHFIHWARTLPYAQEFIFIDELTSSLETLENAFKNISVAITKNNKIRPFDDILKDVKNYIEQIMED